VEALESIVFNSRVMVTTSHLDHDSMTAHADNCIIHYIRYTFLNTILFSTPLK
jgi:hypothetical protein